MARISSINNTIMDEIFFEIDKNGKYFFVKEIPNESEITIPSPQPVRGPPAHGDAERQAVLQKIRQVQQPEVRKVDLVKALVVGLGGVHAPSDQLLPDLGLLQLGLVVGLDPGAQRGPSGRPQWTTQQGASGRQRCGHGHTHQRVGRTPHDVADPARERPWSSCPRRFWPSTAF